MNPLAQLLAERISSTGPLSFADFTQEALYHPEYGYYCQPHKRVGRAPDTDFYTAASFAPVLATLITACVRVLCPQYPTESLHLIEIGAEPEGGIMRHCAQHFFSAHTLRIGDRLEMPSPACVFSNELLDAQPFHRMVFSEGHWREIGVGLKDGQLAEVRFPHPTPLTERITKLCPHPVENYIIDYPSGAETLLTHLAAQSWKGVLLFLDYGHDLQDLLQNYPQGTARAYHRHQQHNDLLANPGQQDITCHVHWDVLEAILREHGFSDVATSRQEAFFMTHAAAVLPSLLKSPSLVAQLRELLHPAYLGTKFQVLHALRS